MAELFTILEKSPAILASIVFFIGWTTTLWGVPAVKTFLKNTAKAQ